MTRDEAMRDYVMAEWEERSRYPRHDIRHASILQLRWIAEAKRHTANAIEIEGVK